MSTASARHRAAHRGRAAALAAVLVAGFCAACVRTADTRVPAPPGTSAAAGTATARAADYEGTWTGTWAREECTETGGAAGVACQRLPDRDELQLRLTPRGAGVEGTLEFTGLRADVSGTVAPDGTLVLKGANTAAAHSTRVTEWRSGMDGADGDRMTGSFTFFIAPDDKALGTVTVRAVIEELVKIP